jgi:Zn-dependent M28 family amino/carboxypeptidase
MIEVAKQFDKRTVQDNLHRHVEHLSGRIGDRHIWKEYSLDRAAEYIESAFTTHKYDVQHQKFSCYGKNVSNLIVEKSGEGDRVIVLGAHYDTVPGSPGADDNASAVAGMLEIARLSREASHKKQLIFVAFVNEEPPCFGSPNMGSMVHAKSLKKRGVPLDVMICLEMIGYFRKDELQAYPFPGMELFYPRTADFLAVVGNFNSVQYVSALKRGIKRNAAINVRSLIAPEQVAGINRSDHFAFWHHGFRAVMVTDTAFYRNKNYHQETDTTDTLNFSSMAEVVKGIYYALQEL